MNHVNIRLAIGRVPYTHGMPKQLVQSLFWSGQQGVQIFFAVSGFLITSTALRRWGSLSKISIRDFYLLRFARIAPLLLMLLAVLSALHFAGLKDFIVKPKTGGLGRALLAALTFHINWLEATRGYVPANWDILWSLSVEEMFYIFFPLICRIVGGGKWLVALLLGFVVMGPFGRTVFAHNDVWKEYSYLGSMDAIALGCLTAIVVSRFSISRWALRILCLTGVALVAFSICFSLRGEQMGLQRTGLGMSIIAVGACMIVIAAAKTQRQSPVALRSLLNIGQRSYEIYLTHMFVVFVLFDWFVAAGKPMGAVAALFVTVILVSSLLGNVVGRYYTEPVNRYLRNRWGEGANRLGSVVENVA